MAFASRGIANNIDNNLLADILWSYSNNQVIKRVGSVYYEGNVLYFDCGICTLRAINIMLTCFGYIVLKVYIKRN